MRHLVRDHSHIIVTLIKTSERDRETGLARLETEYIPNDDFDSATELDFAEIDFELYTDEDVSPRASTKRSVTESFLIAVEQSRILTVEGERFLFKRLNFLKFRASALQATSKKGRKSKKTVSEIDRLLTEARETREQIACANLRLITSIARKLSKSQNEFDEFLSEGNSILLYAIDKFDYARGYRFSTYATTAVQRHIYRLVERNRKQRKREASDQWNTLSQAVGEAGVSVSVHEKANEAVETIIASFDSVLDDREQKIIRARFGLDGNGKARSMRDIGDELGLSKERIRQLLLESIEKLAEFNKPLESIFDQV
jgi:RNA polymerase sigma factor (sigma-70 family)